MPRRRRTTALAVTLTLLALSPRAPARPRETPRVPERPVLVPQVGHATPITRVAVSPDGRHAVSGSFDRAARLRRGRETVADFTAAGRGEELASPAARIVAEALARLE